MKPSKRIAVLAIGALSMLLVDLHFAPEADAVYGRGRRMARRTAVVVVSASSAEKQRSQQQAAQANQEAAAANEEAAEAKEEAKAANARADAAEAAAAQPAPGAQPVGRVVHSLPAGCSAATVGGVEYQHCGADYYRAAFQGSELVYVTAKP